MNANKAQWLSPTQRRIKNAFKFNVRILKERKMFPECRNLADSILYDLATTTIADNYLATLNDFRHLVIDTKDKWMNSAMDRMPMKHTCMSNPLEDFPNKLRNIEWAEHHGIQFSTDRKEKYDILMKVWSEHCLKPLPRSIRQDMEKSFKYKRTRP